MNEKELLELEEKIPAEVKAEISLKILREHRNKLLVESDWTQVGDVPDNIKIPYQAYRQALRDITDTYSSLEEVVWPEKPE